MMSGRTLRAGLVSVVAAIAVAAIASTALGGLKPANDYPVGMGSYDADVGEFLGDKSPDLAVSNRTDGNVSFLEGKGNGKFKSAVNVDAGTRPLGLAAGDFNRDGRRDLIAANQDFASGGLTLLIGQKHGPPEKGPSFATAPGASYPVVADFNRDHKQDVAVSNINDNSVSVLLGNGHGGFGSPHDLTGLPDAFGTAAADLNGDGNPDLATVIDSPNAAVVFYGRGDGTFKARKVIEAGVGLNSLCIAKVNGDSKPDLVLADYSGGALVVLLNKGKGKFGKPHSYATDSSDSPSHDPATVVPFHYDADKHIDFAVADSSDPPDSIGRVSVLRGAKHGKLKPPKRFKVGSQPYGITAGRVNSDHRDDVVAPSSTAQTVSVLLGRK